MSASSAARTLLVLVVLAVPKDVLANDFDDFRIPDNRALLWTGSANMQGSVSGGSSRYRSGHSGSGTTGLSSSVCWLSDADARSTSMTLAVSASGRREHFDRDELDVFSPMTWSIDSRGRRLDESVMAGIDHTRFVAGGPWFVAGQLFGAGGYSQEWASERQHRIIDASNSTTTRDTTSAWFYANRVSASLGVGIGHVRNATGVYEARVLERRLRESGALTRPLSANARTQLASLMYARRDLDVVRDHPAAALWGAIERILRADGAVRDSGITAGEWFRTVEPFFARSGYAGADIAPTSPVVRLRGCSARLVTQLHTEHDLSRYRTSATYEVVAGGIPSPASRASWYSRHQQSYDAALAGVELDGHWPLNERMQIDASGTVLRDIRPHKEGFREYAAGGVTWMIAERWLISTRLAQNRSIIEDSDYFGVRAGSWGVQTEAAATFFVADHVDANLSWSASRSRFEYGRFVSDWQDSRGTGFTFQVTYRFAGFVAIPALQTFLPN